MSISNRDAASVRQTIVRWLHDKLPGADRIELPLPAVPVGGGSSETFFLDPVIRASGRSREERWVLRIEASGHNIYQDASVEKQYRVMQVVGEAGTAPVPAMLWYEADPSLLGAPFLVMQRVEGEVPPGRYHSGGMLADASPADREAMWHAAIEAMAAVHRADVSRFDFLRDPALGANGFEQEIARWDSYRDWCGVPPVPVQDKARQWLEDHKPEPCPDGLAWGDARIANMIFGGAAVRAIIDWETVSLGGAETDLGWWLFFDWHMSHGQGVPRLEGLAGRDETLRIWERCSGRKAEAMEWHEVFATWRFSMISARGHALAARRGITLGSGEHPSLRRLAQLIGS